jgi:hypothetical protein
MPDPSFSGPQAIPPAAESFSQPNSCSTAATPRRPGDPPTRERKLKAVSFAQVDAAREQIKPQPQPRKDSGKVIFAPDATAAETGIASPPPIPPKKPGSLPWSASPDQKAAQEQVRHVRAAISLFAAPPDAAGATSGPQLGEDEMQQIIRLVQDKYGPILDLEQASQVSKFAKQTLRERVSQGRYADSVVRGRPLRFWTHRFLPEVMKP